MGNARDERGAKREKKRVRWQWFWKLLLGLLLLLGFYGAAGFWLLPWVLEKQIAEQGGKALGRPVAVDRVVFNPFTLRFELDGLLVKAKRGRAPLLKIDRFVTDCAGCLSLANRALVLESLRIEGPYVRIVRRPDASYNFSDILQRFAFANKTAPEREETGAGFLFSCNNIKLSGGIIEFFDRRRKTFHWVNELKLTLPRIANLPQLIKSRVQPSLSAVINGTPFKIGGSATPFAKDPDSDFAINIDNLDLAYYLSYLPGERNFSFKDGLLSTRLKLAFRRPPGAPARLSLEGRITLRDLLVQGRGKQRYRFLYLPEVTAELAPGNLLAGEVWVRELNVEKPEINLELKADGAFYLPMLVAAVAKQQVQPAVTGPRPGGPLPAAKKSPLRLTLDRFRLRQARVNLRDGRVSPPFCTHWQPVDIELEKLVYPGSGKAVFTLGLRSEIGEELKAHGDFVLEPGIEVNTAFSLKGIPPARYVAYYDKYFAGRFKDGRIGLAGKVRVSRSPAGELAFQLEDLKATLADLQLVTPAGATFCILPRLELDGGRLDVGKRRFTLAGVSGEKGRVVLVRRADGSFNFRDLLPAAAPAAKGRPAATPVSAERRQGAAPVPAPWEIRLEAGSLRDFSLLFRDQTLKPEAELKLDALALDLRRLSTVAGETGSLSLTLRPAGRGRLRLAGRLGLVPLRAGLDLKLESFPLKALQPYISSHLALTVVRGTAGISGRLQLTPGSAGEPELCFAGAARVDRLRTVDAVRAANFLALRRLALADIAFRSRPPQLALGRIRVQGLRSTVRREKDGHTNLALILRQPVPAAREEPAAPPAANPAAANPFKLFIEKVEVADSALQFVDLSVSPLFKLGLDQLKGEISGLGTLGQKPARIRLAGRLNRQAPVTVSGSLDPFASTLFADLKIVGKGIGLTDLSPYSGRYVGYAIGKGKATLNLEYRIARRQLKARNEIFLDQFDFGSPVASPEAVSLPVRLAVALLKDRSGEIHLDLPVAGNLDDPRFSLGGVIFKVLVNLITKAVTSPFAIIGSLVGGGAELNQIEFAAGSARLEKKALSRLDKLARALYDRPALKVEIIGRADRIADGKALHERAFLRLLQVEKFKALAAKGEAPESPEKVSITPGSEEFATYLWRAYKHASFPRQKNLIGMVKKIAPELQEKLLREHLEIGDSELKELARQRAKAVMHYLAAKGPVEAERLFLVDPRLEENNPAGRRVELKIK